MGLGRTGNWLLLKQCCYALSLPVQPLPSHPPSTPYPTRAMIPPLITWPHRLEWENNLKTPSVSLVRAWRKKQKGSILPLPLPSHLFSLSKPISSLSWKWLLMFDTKYPSGKRNKRRKKKLREKGNIIRMPMSRFKIFGVYQMLTISQFLGWGKGNVAQNKDNFTGGTKGKLCYLKRGLEKLFLFFAQTGKCQRSEAHLKS